MLYGGIIMSVISLNMPSFSISITDADSDMKRKIFDCFESAVDEYENEIFDDVMYLPALLEKFSEVSFLETDNYLGFDKEIDLFLLLNQLFGDTYLVVADEWDYEEDDDWDEDDEDEEDGDDWDESDEVNGTKRVRLYEPDGMKKCTFELSFHEILDMGGGSNGADVDFVNETGIKEEQLEKKTPSDSFVEEIVKKAKEKGHTDLVGLINEKVRNTQ